MNLRKSLFFKPLCLLVAALFTTQCITYERKLISTEEKVIENGIQAYVYELEKIKIPSSQDPIIEYRVVKFPAYRVETINTYQKIRKTNRSGPVLGGILAGAIIGGFLGYHSESEKYWISKSRATGQGILIGTILGGIGGLMAGRQIGEKDGIKENIKVPSTRSQGKKPDSISLPAQNLPLDLKWGTRGKSNSFKTRTDDQGFVRIHLVNDLKIMKVPPDYPIILYIYFLNPELQVKEILKDSLGPEK